MAVGGKGNAWNNVATGAGGNSNSVYIAYDWLVNCVGNMSGATTVKAQVSPDNVTWYDAGVSAVLAGASDFNLNFQCALPYVRLSSTNNVTATASIFSQA